MSDKYNDGVLDEKFENIHDKMDDQFEATMKILADIKEQTTKTNGRVTNQEKWRERMTGFSNAIGLFMTFVIVPLLGLSMYEIFIEIPNKLANQPEENAAALKGVLGDYGLREINR